MEIHQLRYVVAAGRYLNFTKAADSLYISQPSLSQQIAKLEQELGTPLFVRAARSVSLTPAGKEFVEYAEKVLEELDRMERSFSRYKVPEKKELKVGIVTTIGDFGFRDMLADFRGAHPEWTVNNVSNHGEGLLDSLRAHELDACIIMCPDYAIAEQGFRYAKLLDEPLVAVLSTRHPLVKKEHVSLEDFRDEPVFASPKRIRPDCVGNMRLLHDSFVELGIQKEFIEYRHIDEVLQRVAVNEGALFMFRHSMMSRTHPKWTIRPVKPELKMSLYLVCAPDCEHPAMDALFAFAEEYSGYQGSSMD